MHRLIAAHKSSGTGLGDTDFLAAQVAHVDLVLLCHRFLLLPWPLQRQRTLPQTMKVAVLHRNQLAQPLEVGVGYHDGDPVRRAEVKRG